MSEPLIWRVNQGREEPSKRAIAIAAAAFAFGIGVALYQSPILGFIGAVLVLLSLAEVLFPIKFELNEQKIKRSCGPSLSEMDWSLVKRVIPDEHGVKLSPFEKPNRMEAFRGIYLRYGNNQDAVLAKIRAHWNGDPEALAGGAPGGGGSGTDREDLDQDRGSAHDDARDPRSRDAQAVE